MKYTPRLLKAEMVRATLDGRKTQTRQQGIPSDADYVEHYHGELWDLKRHDGHRLGTIKCPFGEIGDRLWVRETWQYEDWTEDGQPFIHYRATSDVDLCWPPEDWVEKLTGIWEGLSEPENYNIKKRACDQKWRPSIFMPRWASRITLEITDVRVERLQDISEEDAIAEGCDNSKSEAAKVVGWYEKPVRAFRRLWDSIYGNWKDNPWVWVVEFKVIKP